jgi:hypothetical protein
MGDFSSIRALLFSEKRDELPIWNEKLLAKSKRSGFKDVSIGELNIAKSDEENEKTEEGKVLMKNAHLNEIAYTELIPSIDVRSSSGKVLFSIIKGCKSRDYSDGNSALALDKLKNKFDPGMPLN